ncbi:MAG: PDGLE domain-containing protein [Actinobacteria bacterium]|nr:PDGLE domain-containing protein [Actinomycetota bacterium]
MNKEKEKNQPAINAALWVFIGIALIVCAVLAVFVSPWASSSPDGLEKVAEDKGFIEAAEEADTAWDHSPVPDYAVPGVTNEKAATGLAGFVGILLTIVIMLGVSFLVIGLGKLFNDKRAAVT